MKTHRKRQTRPFFNNRLLLPLTITALLYNTAACSETSTANTDNSIRTAESSNYVATDTDSSTPSNDLKPSFTTQTIATFSEPWAMTVLAKDANNTSESQKLFVTQKTGELFIVDIVTGAKTAVTGVPKVAYGGQGGLGDIILAPDFATTNNIYMSYVEAGDDSTFGAKVIKAQLVGLETANPSLQAITPIWQQTPKMKGQGHYSHRLLFSPDGRYLYISSGDRQKQDPAQDMSVNLGKIIRLNPDGSIPVDNPYADNTDISRQFWSTGHRNILGMSFDDSGKLWAHEMGPRGGDEFNLIEKGQNYGWPIVSNGRNYSGVDIPDHNTRPEFTAPKVSWTPVISPSAISIYSSSAESDFPAWQGNALISGLSSKALIVVAIDNEQAIERYRYDMNERIRSVLTVSGQVFLLEDGEDGRLLKLVPDEKL